MTQLTDEQVKYALSREDVPWKEIKTREDAIRYMQCLLSPPPSYGEIFQNAKYEFNKQYATWDDLGENRKSAIEAAAQAVIRAFVEREVKPIYAGVNPASTTVTNAGIVLDSLEKLIARVEG